jgi:dinuclear metal center YbgI/SA1388 family protein
MKKNKVAKEIRREELVYFLHEYLLVKQFSDYAPNGLQVEGREKLKKILFAVSATQESITQACALGADALIVHHGLFWNHQGAKPVTGPFAQRLVPLIQNGINLLAYHLPLDAHAEVGNAATLAREVGLVELAPFGDYKGSPLGVQGSFSKPIKGNLLKSKLEKILGREVWHSQPDDPGVISTMGIITGGANREWVSAQRAGLDAFLTGEMSEYDWHDAKEAGVHMFAGGHHATERLGIQALMDKIQATYAVECYFADSANPA